MAAGLHRNHQLADIQWAAARGVPLPHPPGERGVPAHSEPQKKPRGAGGSQGARVTSPDARDPEEAPGHDLGVPGTQLPALGAAAAMAKPSPGTDTLHNVPASWQGLPCPKQLKDTSRGHIRHPRSAGTRHRAGFGCCGVPGAQSPRKTGFSPGRDGFISASGARSWSSTCPSLMMWRT